MQYQNYSKYKVLRDERKKKLRVRNDKIKRKLYTKRFVASALIVLTIEGTIFSNKNLVYAADETPKSNTMGIYAINDYSANPDYPKPINNLDTVYNNASEMYASDYLSKYTKSFCQRNAYVTQSDFTSQGNKSGGVDSVDLAIYIGHGYSASKNKHTNVAALVLGSGTSSVPSSFFANRRIEFKRSERNL